MSNNSNAFMASAKKSKRQQASIQHAQPEVDELVCINVRIPKSILCPFNASLMSHSSSGSTSKLVSCPSRQ